ncbi:hypothetical protein U1Q18_032318 [Sarracenia purpurea var. burkii]
MAFIVTIPAVSLIGCVKLATGSPLDPIVSADRKVENPSLAAVDVVFAARVGHHPYDVEVVALDSESGSLGGGEVEGSDEEEEKKGKGDKRFEAIVHDYLAEADDKLLSSFRPRKHLKKTQSQGFDEDKLQKIMEELKMSMNGKVSLIMIQLRILAISIN